jgi:hypothetical protein
MPPGWDDRREMLAGVAQRQAFFDSLGLEFVRVSPTEETMLTDSYVIVRCHVVLFVAEGQAPRVVFALTHGDLATIMREHGLLS